MLIREEVLNAIDKHHQSECDKVIQDLVKESKVMAALYVVRSVEHGLLAPQMLSKTKSSLQKSKTT